MTERRARMKFDFPEVYARAIRIRAALDGVNQIDVVMVALDRYLAAEIKEAQARIEATSRSKDSARKSGKDRE